MLKVEFLYYDKTACKRCASTDRAVKRTLEELKGAMKDSGENIEFIERTLKASEMRRSPTVLINGKDVEELTGGRRLKSNTCSDCCKLVGSPVKCRTFRYKERSYDYIPRQMIMDAIKVAIRRVSR